MKRSPKPGDMNQRMYAVVQQAAGLTDEPVKDEQAVARGRLGGRARAKGLTVEQRVAAAKRAREARAEKARQAIKLQSEKPAR